MTAVLGFLSSIFRVFRRRHHQTPSDQQLDDIGAIMDDDYYKRDIVVAGKKISTSLYLREQIGAVRDVGHLAWIGGPAAAKFASDHLLEFVTLLLHENTPLELKKQLLFAILEICIGIRENQDKARAMGVMTILHELLDSCDADVRRGATACLVIFVNDNYDNHEVTLKLPKMKEKLLHTLQDDWRAWKRNEAARLILMLGLNRVGMDIP